MPWAEGNYEEMITRDNDRTSNTEQTLETKPEKRLKLIRKRCTSGELCGSFFLWEGSPWEGAGQVEPLREITEAFFSTGTRDPGRSARPCTCRSSGTWTLNPSPSAPASPSYCLPLALIMRTTHASRLTRTSPATSPSLSAATHQGSFLRPSLFRPLRLSPFHAWNL